MKKTGFPALVFLVLTAFQVDGQSGWVMKSPLLQPRAELASVVHNNNIYVLGGTDTAGEGMNNLDVYYSLTDTWNSHLGMPTPREELVACELGGEIYAIGGGFNAVSMVAVEVFNFNTGSWLFRPSMPTGRREANIAVVDGILYVFGGIGTPGSELKAESFDPVANLWTTRLPLPSDRKYAVCGVVDGKVFLIGGDGVFNITDECIEYDPVTDSWTTRSPAPGPIHRAGFCVYQSKIYFIGGHDGSAVLGGGYIFDPAADSWTPLPELNIPRESLTAAVVNGMMYAIGGFDAQHQVCDAVEMMDLTVGVETVAPASKGNAWSDGEALHFRPGQTGRFHLSLTDMTGRILLLETVDFTGSEVFTARIPLAPGLYAARLWNEDARLEYKVSELR